MLKGRQREIGTLTGLLDEARAGRGSALIVRGEAGIGKTALLEHAAQTGSAMRLLRATGVEFEMGLPFSGLHQLLAPLSGRLGRLPDRQREALETAFGLRSADAPDRLMVAMATLTLISEIAEERPVLCLVDDVQWLDEASAKALAFAARRIAAEPVAMLLGLRDPVRIPELDSLPSLTVPELSDSDARALLTAALHAPLDEPIRDRIVAEARGNPLALLELTVGIRPGEMAGGFGLPVRGGAMEELFRRRLDDLPDPTRLLLLTASAEPLGDPLLLWDAVRRLGLDVAAAAPAEDAGLLEIDARVRFRHPLVRSAAYRSASPSQRRAVHKALAEATDPALDPDRRAWHRAQAAAGPDEDIAADLAAAADRVRMRGGLAATAAFLERSAHLTTDPSTRLTRLLAAAGVKLDAGAPDDAVALLAHVDEAVLSPMAQAQVETLRGRIAFAVRRGMDASAPLLRAAQRVEPLNARLAREIHLDALFASVLAGHLGGDIDTAVQAARAAVPAPHPPTVVDVLLDGLTLILTGDRPVGAALVRQALAEGDDAMWARRVQMVGALAFEVWDVDSYVSILNRQISRARTLGALTLLPQALSTVAGAHLRLGQLHTAASLLDQATELVAATGTAPSYPHLTLAAWQGDSATEDMVGAAVKDATARGEGLLVAFAHFALAIHRNGHGDYTGALAAAEYASSHLVLVFKGAASRELVEAATRADAPDIAQQAFADLRETTQASTTDFAAGTEHLCAGLITHGAQADHHYQAALEALTASGCLGDLERARLLYGEWLRRQGRRSEARKQLREAHEALTAMGAEGFAQRAARELGATGERARKRAAGDTDRLTAQELAIARQVAAGATSKEIAAELFVSPRTVDAHLRNIFRKLSITSRRQLRGMPLDDLAHA
ncbi:LuxR family transcriptional regulator [Nonomuraea africana]|uniref:DNA-binding CsgD family transcriptional regulator n=1 Tax=Nonomuraea africana TaxID=46171 RepID=A0ABR9K634_9ACTN|nr:AAA family ATPase [Nonomuraea africana]MBE1557474.1 DNA-binding CsgD family transcriptional regulator [Nonomuraea africana]